VVDQAKYDLVNQHKGGAVALAPLLGRSAAVLSNKVNPHVDTHHLTLDEAITLQAITQNYELLKATASMLNHVAVELPSDDLANTSDLELLDCWAAWQEDCGQTAALIRKALEDGNISQEELSGIRREMFEDIGRELEFLQRLEALAHDAKS
jgi:hypothetical protein